MHPRACCFAANVPQSLQVDWCVLPSDRKKKGWLLRTPDVCTCVYRRMRRSVSRLIYKPVWINNRRFNYIRKSSCCSLRLSAVVFLVLDPCCFLSARYCTSLFRDHPCPYAKTAERERETETETQLYFGLSCEGCLTTGTPLHAKPRKYQRELEMSLLVTLNTTTRQTAVQSWASTLDKQQLVCVASRTDLLLSRASFCLCLAASSLTSLQAVLHHLLATAEMLLGNVCIGHLALRLSVGAVPRAARRPVWGTKTRTHEDDAHQPRTSCSVPL